MQPQLNINDIIVVKKCDIRDLNKNDIITFTKDEKIISHRIVKIIEKEHDRAFVTKGDHNEINDKGIVEKEQIYGKVIFSKNAIMKCINGF